MKLAEFNALCDREWAKPKRGDVVSLLLTGPSAAELCVDLLAGVSGTASLWMIRTPPSVPSACSSARW